LSENNSNTFIAPDKMQAMNRLAKSSVYWHGVYEDELDKIKEATLKITNFLIYDFKKDINAEIKFTNMTPEQVLKHITDNTKEVEHPIIYPYAPENQVEFESNITEMEMATHSIYPVILNIQKEFNSINSEEKMQQQGAGPAATVVMPQPRNFSFFSRKDKTSENVTDITASSRSMNLIDRLMQVPVLATKFKSYHWERVTDSMTTLRGKRKAQLNLLAVEIVYYHTVVKPMILNTIGEGMRINLLAEKKDIVNILGPAQQMHNRRDMQPQPFTPM